MLEEAETVALRINGLSTEEIERSGPKFLDEEAKKKNVNSKEGNVHSNFTDISGNFLEFML